MSKHSVQEVWQIWTEETFLRVKKIKSIKAEINEIDDKKWRLTKFKDIFMKGLIR